MFESFKKVKSNFPAKIYSATDFSCILRSSLKSPISQTFCESDFAVDRLTSNLNINSAKMPKKASGLLNLPSSPKKEATLENSSMARVCRDSRDWMAG